MIVLDWTGMLNIFISVATGSVVATIIVWRLIGYFGRKSLLSILTDPKIQKAASEFIKNHVVKPFNSVNNEDVKHLATEVLELALKKIKEKK